MVDKIINLENIEIMRREEILQKLNVARAKILLDVSDKEADALQLRLYDSIIGKIQSMLSPEESAEKKVADSIKKELEAELDGFDRACGIFLRMTRGEAIKGIERGMTKLEDASLEHLVRKIGYPDALVNELKAEITGMKKALEIIKHST